MSGLGGSKWKKKRPQAPTCPVSQVVEIAKGIGLLAAGRKKKALTSWLTGLETKFGDRMLAIDVETTRIQGRSGLACSGLAFRFVAH